MAILHEWLGSLAVKELESALDVFKNYIPGVHRQNSNNTLSCAPEKVTIYQKKTKALQIVKYLESVSSSSSSLGQMVLVSDGTSLIKAVFEEDSIAEFEKSHGRSFTGLKGGTIRSSRSNLVFHRDATPAEALQLHVVAFTLLGGEGANICGSPKSYISTTPCLEPIFEKLNELLSGPLASSSSSSLPANSGPKDPTPSQMLNTQFMTQVPSTQPATKNMRSDHFKGRHKDMVSDNDEENYATQRASNLRSSSPYKDRPSRAMINNCQDSVTTTNKAIHEETNLVFYDPFQIDSPFENMKRVPRKFARVPKEQQALLLNEDCWYDFSVQVAYIPDSVRKDLEKFYEPRKIPRESSEASYEEDEEDESDSLDLPVHNSTDTRISNDRKLHSSPSNSIPEYSHILHREAGGSMQVRPRKIISTTISRSPAMGVDGSTREQPQKARTPRVSRSPPLNLAIPVTMGELADDEDEDMLLPSPMPPSTAIIRSSVIQVKRTPREEVEARRERLAMKDPEREDHEHSSSNPPVIPATLDKDSQPCQSNMNAERDGEIQAQPMVHYLADESKLSQPGIQGGLVRSVPSVLLVSRSTSPHSTRPDSSLASKAQDASIGVMPSQIMETKKVSSPSINAPAPTKNVLASSPMTNATITIKKRKRKVLGKTESEFFANRAVDDPMIAIRKIKQELMHNEPIQANRKAKAQEEFPNDVTRIKSPRPPLSNYSTSLLSAAEVDVETPASKNLPQDSIKLEPSKLKQKILSSSTTDSPDEMPVTNHHSQNPTIEDFEVGGSDNYLIHDNKSFQSGSPGIPDEEFQPASSPRSDFRRQSIVNIQKLVLSTESEEVAPEDPRNDGYEKELAVTPANTRYPDIRNDEFEGSSNDSDDQESLRAHEDVSRADAPVFFYGRFKSQYSDYTGTQELFTTALVYLEWLWTNRKYLPEFLYDDFINFYPEEYLALNGDKLHKTGHELFCERVKLPIFREEVISARNLQDAINSLDGALVRKIRARFVNPRRATPDRSRSASQACRLSKQPSPLPKSKSVKRMPHFDTPSQVTPSKRKEAPLDLNSSHSSAKKHRTLPSLSKSTFPNTILAHPQPPHFQGNPASPELGDANFQSRSHRPSTRTINPMLRISPPPLKDPNRRKTVGTDKILESKSKARVRASIGSMDEVDIGPDPRIFAAWLKNKGPSILRESKSPSAASSVRSSSSRRRA